MFTVPQLIFLCKCIEETSGTEGSVVEVGCETGVTTVFLNKFMDALGIQKHYYALDTFSGFVKEDVEFEVLTRNKRRSDYRSLFTVNSRKWFDWTMTRNGITRVRSILADANTFDFSRIGPISFCLLDVDLYRPIRKCLPAIYDVLSPGGILVVDDCDASNSQWDGAEQAYREFVSAQKITAEIRHGKFGIINKSLSLSS